MNKSKTLFVLVFFLSSMIIFLGIAVAQVEVGVKQGDWIEYELYLIQNELETSGKYRLEVFSVQGNYVVMNLTLKYPDTSDEFDIVEGEVGQDFLQGWIIPSKLSVGDSFHEDGSSRYDEFVVTISGKKEITCCGDKRQVVYSSDSQMEGMTNYWDVETGMLLEATRQTDFSTYHIKAVNSNLWKNKSEGSDDTILIYGIGASVVAAVAIGVFFLKIKK